MKTRILFSITLFCAAIALVISPRAATRTVQATAAGTQRYVSTSGDDTANDCADSMNPCATIGYAVSQSNPGDTVNVAAGTYTEHGITVDKNLTIKGHSAIDTTVQAAATQAMATDRVFNISSGTTVTISGLTITNGNVTGNLGGAIWNNQATLTIEGCAISHNSAPSGGAIWNNGAGAMLTVRNSTISGNSAPNFGGGIINWGFFGTAMVTVSNSTISGNSAGDGGGIYNLASDDTASATLTVLNSTFSGNSGSHGDNISNNPTTAGASTTLTIGSTILNAGASFNIFNNNGTVTSNGYNLSSDAGVTNSGFGATGALNATGDQTNTNPMLGPLAYYGGPTATHILLTGSPAIDKGKNFSGATTDQRGPGFPRTVGSAAVTGGDGTDIGAFERQANDVDPTLIVTTTDDTNANNTCDPANPCSLRDAITAANASGPDDVIDFAVTGTITLHSQLPNLSSNMQILGPAANALTVMGDPAAVLLIFTVTSGKTITIAGLTITNDTFPGGGIVNDHSTLTVNNCTISNNAGYDGCGIYNNAYGGGSATLTINNSTLSGNSAHEIAGPGGFGGAIYNNGANGGSAILTINNCTFSGNTAELSGGGIFNVGTLTIKNSTFSGNAGLGSNIYNESTTLTIGGTILKAGSGAGDGNIYNYAGTVNSLGYNLSSDSGVTNDGGGTGDLNATGDQKNTDPLLDPNGLQNNGGPTLTIALQPNSPAIDKGKDFTGSPNDQRGSGFARTVDDGTIMNATGGDGTDIGAFEKQTVNPCPQVLTATVNDSVTGIGLNQWDYTSGGWSYYAANNFFVAYQKDEHYAPTTGTKAHFRFHGNQVKIYTVKEPAGGFIHYTLDGGALDDQLVDNYSATQVGNVLSYTSPIVPVGDHDLVVEVNGTHASGSSNTITVDKAEVYDAVCAPPPVVQALAATINDNDTGTGNNQFDYTSGGWSYYTAGNFNTAFQNDEHYAFTTGKFALFRFNGTQVKVYTVKEPAGGNIRYTLDGGTDVQIIDNYSSTQMGNALSYTSPVVASGNHILKIEVLGTHNMGSSNTITIDKAEVYVSSVGPTLTATVNDNTTGPGPNQFDYSGGGWSYYSNPSFTTAFQMDEHYAFGAGVKAFFRFTGTQVKIYTVKEPADGNIRYVLDTNVDIQTINNYSPTQVGNSLSYTSPVVPAGNHVLIIQVDGTHGPGTSNTITVDKAEVFGGP